MFKQCGKCDHVWPTRDTFLDDPDIEIVGYQANFRELMAGLLYFNHACKSTLAISADAFADLYHGPVFEKRQTGSEDCPGYCLHKDELRPCPAECECAFVREIIQCIEDRKKQRQA